MNFKQPKIHIDIMIDFACKDIETEELIRCSFQISRTDYRILRKLLESDEMETREIAVEMGIDRTTAHKSLKNLRKRKLITRKQYNIPTGGYKYFYRAKNKDRIKERIRNLIENWSSSAKESLENW